MNAQIFQHVPFEGPGSIELWLKAAGYTISATQFFSSFRLPRPDDIDLLIVMGGPMSVNDENKFPWLAPEKKFIYDIITAGKPVLGVCLGAQLIASALGANVYKNPVKEIGWFPVEGIRSDDRTIFSFPQSIDVFHWHGETFDLPSGTVRLAQSRGCINQAFQFNSSTIGLQFHLETTPGSAQELVSHCRDELVTSQYSQPEAEILGVSPEKYQHINELMNNVLSFICSRTVSTCSL